MTATSTEVEPAGPAGSARGGRLRAVLLALAVVAVFAVVGAGSGWLWHHLWTAPQGMAVRQKWYPLDETALGGMFDATGLYITIGFGAGLVLGVLTALLVRRLELVMVAAVLVGSGLAAWLCHLVGLHLGPPDPAAAAATASDYTRIPAAMTTPGHSFYAAWPFGALLGLAITYLLTPRHDPVAPPPHRPGSPPV